jgi:predicted nucleotide-binding protein (sugar kinase/HSP70/actin superfamily)
MVKVGIPRALLYYQYYPMWQSFFEGLGAEVIVSPLTTQAMLAAGSSRVVADTCLPVKAYCGHVLALTDKCDCIFIPALRSIKKKIFNCSKFLGLPDMTRAVIPECPPILDIDIDINKGKRKLYQAIYRLGRHFSWDPLRIRRAALDAWVAHREYRELMVKEGLTPPQAIARLSGEETAPSSPDKAAIALVGHPYLLYDELINHRLIHRLEQAGYRVLTPEMLTPEQLETAITRLTGQPYWTYEEEVVGCGGHSLESGVEGVIGVIAFGCGPDSLMMDMVQRQAIRLKTTPFMSLTLEEHTAEAGIVTRLEAFLDMIERRKRKEAKVCS